MANEKRLIDANVWRHETCVWCNEHYPDDPCEPSDCPAMQYIDNFPTVDAAEVVHGHWCWEGRFRACSECGSYVEFTETLGASHWKYCPYCGAKMDGGNEDG